MEKYEVEDRLPVIYKETTGRKFGVKRLDDSQPFGATEMDILKRVAGDDQIHFELVRELLQVQRSYRSSGRRAKLFERLEEAFKRGFYNDVEDATARAARRRNLAALLEAVGEASGSSGEAAKALQAELGELAKFQNPEAAE